MNKLMLALAVGAAALAMVWAGGAAEADDDRFRFADCSVEFILQDGRFVAVDGRSWLEVDPVGECRETAENDESSADDESAGGEGDDSSADDEGDGSRSAAAETNQQDDGEDGTGSADSSFEPPLPASVVDELARQAQERQNGASGAPRPCTDAVRPATGPALISFQNNDHCVIVRDGGAVQVSRGEYTLNATLPAGRDWRAYSFKHALVGDLFGFSEITTPYIFATVNLNAADGAVLKRSAGDCEDDYAYEGERVLIASSTVSRDAHGTVVAASWTTRDGTVHQGFPPDGVLVCPSTLVDASIASVTVPATATGE